jgi:hypothetical protein
MVGALVACSDQAPVSAPGTLTATLVSPNGAEGAAVIGLTGEGIGAAAGLGDVTLFRADDVDRTTLVLVSPGGGVLSFSVALADTTRRPAVALAQVAAPDDELRASLTGYRVDWSR